METGDRYTDRWSMWTSVGQRCVELAKDAAPRIMVGELSAEDVTADIYSKLPSGDYGRGDVRRVVNAALGPHRT